MSSLIGLDIGHRHVRAVKLVPKGSTWQIQGAATASRFDEHGKVKALAQSLMELDNRLPLKGDITVSSSDLSCMVRFEANDPMPDERIEKVLRLELSQHSGGEEATDMAADAVKVPIGGDQIIHCCGLAQAPQVLGLLTELQNTGIKANRVQLAPAATANLAHALPVRMDEDADEDSSGEVYALIVDIGAHYTRIALVRDTEFLACRQLPTGGDAFTEALVQDRKISFREAEAIKLGKKGETIRRGENKESTSAVFAKAEAEYQAEQDPELSDSIVQTLGLNPTQLFQDDDPLQEEDDGLPLPADPSGPLFTDVVVPGPTVGLKTEDIAAAAARKPSAFEEEEELELSEVEPVQEEEPGKSTRSFAVQQMGPELLRVADDLFAQINRSIAWFQTQLKVTGIDRQISGLYLVGGGAQLSGLDGYFKRRYASIKHIEILNPFSGMTGTEPEQPSLYGQAIGLALSNQKNKIHFDLRPESLQHKQAFRSKVIWPRIAAAALLIAFGAFGYGLWLSQEGDRARIEVVNKLKAKHKKLNNEMRRLQKRSEDVKNELRSIAMRINSGRDALDLIKAIKKNIPDSIWIVKISTDPIDYKGNLLETEDEEQDSNIVERGKMYVRGHFKYDDQKDNDQWRRASAKLDNFMAAMDSHISLQRGSRLFNRDGTERLRLVPPDIDSDIATFLLVFTFAPIRLDQLVNEELD